MTDIDNLTKQLIEFRDKRDWAQFHDSKNLALALSIEAAELNELFLWKSTPEDIANISKDRLSEELADVIAYALLLAEKNNFNVTKIVEDKILLNNKKYPIDKSKGTSKKYNEL
jgi:NTP pyrophosphatase (non-canonical NTP hydrolase)